MMLLSTRFEIRWGVLMNCFLWLLEHFSKVGSNAGFLDYLDCVRYSFVQGVSQSVRKLGWYLIGLGY